MDDIIKKYCPRYEFDSYEDMKKNFKINVPDDFNFGFDVVDAWAEIDPEKLALIWTDDSKILQKFTFKDIKEKSNRIVNFLKDNGIKKGDVVFLILKQIPEIWTVLVALHKLGAIAIPASFQLVKHDLVYRFNFAKVKMVITVDDDYVVNNIKESMAESPSVEKYVTIGDKPVPGAIDFNSVIDNYSPAYERPVGDENTKVTDTQSYYFTSGTNGMPKMVRHDFSSPLGQITTARFWQNVREGDIQLTQNDSGWAKFAWGKIYGQWICGATIGAYNAGSSGKRTNEFDMLDAIEKIRPNVVCLPATFYRSLARDDLSSYDFSFIDHFCVAGEALNPEVFKLIKEKTGKDIYEGFGQTESSVLLANFMWDESKYGSLGKPAPIYNIDIADDNGIPCEDGIVGNICIRNIDKEYPVGLFKEYVNDPDAMADGFNNGCYFTGDTGWRDSDGYYWFHSRRDDVIKSSGYRIGPFEVESALMEHPAVKECAATAYPDATRGDIVKASIVLSEGFEGTDELTKELQNHVKHATAPYKYPRMVVYVDALPKTTSGKIIRKAIRDADIEKLKKEGKI